MSDPKLTAPEILAAAGRAIYGEEWQNPLARALGINERNMRRIAAAARAGEPYPVAPGALRDLSKLLAAAEPELRARADACRAVCGPLAALLA